MRKFIITESQIAKINNHVPVYAGCEECEKLGAFRVGRTPFIKEDSLEEIK